MHVLSTKNADTGYLQNRATKCFPAKRASKIIASHRIASHRIASHCIALHCINIHIRRQRNRAHTCKTTWALRTIAEASTDRFASVPTATARARARPAGKPKRVCAGWLVERSGAVHGAVNMAGEQVLAASMQACRRVPVGLAARRRGAGCWMAAAGSGLARTGPGWPGPRTIERAVVGRRSACGSEDPCADDAEFSFQERDSRSKKKEVVAVGVTNALFI